MEHAGARDAYTHAYVYIYTFFIFYYPFLSSLSCLVPRIQILSHRPAMCFRTSRVSRGGSSIQIEEG